MVVEEEGGGERSSGSDIISAVRGRLIGSGSVNSSGGDATQCQPKASPDQGVCRAD